jgi:hypothetical protein
MKKRFGLASTFKKSKVCPAWANLAFRRDKDFQILLKDSSKAAIPYGVTVEFFRTHF